MLADRNESGLSETGDLIKDAASGCEFLKLPTDVSKAESVEDLIEDAVIRFGRLDYVCNAAGIGSSRQVRAFSS